MRCRFVCHKVCHAIRFRLRLRFGEKIVNTYSTFFSVEYLAVMQAIGNEAANRLWEHNSPRESKPSPDSPRELKEQWVRNKYEGKRFLPPVRVDNTLGNQIVQAVIAR